MRASESQFFWLKTAQLPLLPAALCHTLLGLALACFFQAPFQLLPTLVAFLSTSFFFLGGNFLNAWADRESDALHHPSRPLPRGIVSPLSYQLKSIRFLALGLITSALLSPLSFAIALWILAQILLAQFRKSHALASSIHYGIARASLVALGFSALAPSIHSPMLAAAKFPLALHFFAIALYATGKMFAHRRRLFLPLLLLAAPLLAGFWWTELALSSRPLVFLTLLPSILLLRRIPRHPLLQRHHLVSIQPLIEFAALPALAWSMCRQNFPNLLQHPALIVLALAPLLAFFFARLSPPSTLSPQSP